jgi:hypothetical protein
MSEEDVFNFEGGIQAEEGEDAGHLSGFTPSLPPDVRLSDFTVIILKFIPVIFFQIHPDSQ